MAASSSPVLLSLENVSKHYQLGDTIIKALDEVNLEVKESEFISVMGPSGSGKSTFLQVASILAEPSSGTIILKGKEVTQYDENQRAAIRNSEIGFIFQQFNLLARTSALDNVALPLLYAGVPAAERKQRAEEMLAKVGLQDRMQNTSAQLSGGQQQRVAVARALINNPAIIFADEPTGNLDSKSSADILDLIKKLHQEKKTIIMVTHEEEVAAIAKRHLTFQDGRITSDTKKKITPKKHDLKSKL